ncbi:hypothetical protein AB0O07_22305 [Streptomyces sp. NPDC093085]|uniref:hypothetical protein n=1 Tax=Streptomyces sp. NPDC093085 TaxID=3155068 RepID=UPI003445A57E
MVTTTLQGIPAAALEALAAPDLDRLGEAKARGAECVWCPTRLTGDTAVDLGERKSIEGWLLFPRACPSCTATAARRALLDHRGRCEQCVDDAAQCLLGSGLYGLMRTCRALQGGAR